MACFDDVELVTGKLIVGGGNPFPCMRAASPKAVERCSSDLKFPVVISAGMTFSYSNCARLLSDTKVVNERSPTIIRENLMMIVGTETEILFVTHLPVELMEFVPIAQLGHYLLDTIRVLIHHHIIF